MSGTERTSIFCFSYCRSGRYVVFRIQQAIDILCRGQKEPSIFCFSDRRSGRYFIFRAEKVAGISLFGHFKPRIAGSMVPYVPSKIHEQISQQGSFTSQKNSIVDCKVVGASKFNWKLIYAQCFSCPCKRKMHTHVSGKDCHGQHKQIL